MTSGVTVAPKLQTPGRQPQRRSTLAVKLARLWPRQGQWTEEQYFALPVNNYLVELSEGELIILSPPSDAHQSASLNLSFALYTFVQAHQWGVVRYAPLPVRLWPGKIREPDVLFVAAEHAERIGDQVYGPPDLVAEIVSPSTARTDRQQKLVEYAQAGITEYWILDPAERTVEVYTLREGAYVSRGRYGAGETAESGLLSGFVVAVDTIFTA